MNERSGFHDRRRDDPRIDEILHEMMQMKIQMAGVLTHLEDERNYRIRVQEVIFGNGRPGIDKRLDRLEQTEAGRSKHLWAIWLSILGVFGAWLGKKLIAGD